MANYNILFSPTGGTARVANAICGAWGGAWETVDLCRKTAERTLAAEDICIVSVPSFGGRVPEIALERLRALRGSGAKAVLVCVYGNREWEDTLTELQDTLEGADFVCVAAIAAVAEHSIFRQFAAGRPDAADEAQLSDFVRQIREKIASGSLSVPELAGSHGTYKEYHGVPFKPAGNDKCTDCGLCAERCPGDAIPLAEPGKTDREACISCMRCVAICPQHARDFDPEMMRAAAAKMESRLGGHKENHLFL